MRRLALGALVLLPVCAVVACGADVRLGDFASGATVDDEGGAADEASAAEGGTAPDGGVTDADAATDVGVDAPIDTGADAACTIDCKGNPCVANVCQPLVLASGQSGALWITADATDVFWTTTGHAGTIADPNVVARVPKIGGATVVLNADPGQAFGVSVDATLVYWLRKNGTSSTLSSASKADGTAQTLVGTLPDGSNPQGLGDNGFNLFAVDDAELRAFQKNQTNSTGVQVNLPYDGGAPSMIAGEGLAVGTDVVFVADRGDSAVKLVASAGGVVPVALPTPPVDVCFDQQLFYAAGTSVGRIPLVTKIPVQLAAGTGMGGVTTDATTVYFTTTTTVQKVDKAGGATTTLVTGLVKGGRLVVDGTYVYFADPGSGIIGRIPK